MLHYAIIFFVLALIAALFGWGTLSAMLAVIGKILFFLFIIVSVGMFLWGWRKGVLKVSITRDHQ